MHLQWISVLAIAAASAVSASPSSAVAPRAWFKTCKNLPGDAGWPSTKSWSSLNSTVDGQLIKYVPTGAVCSQSSGHYDAAACAALLPVYWRQAYVDLDPGLIRCFEYTNNTCDPSSDPSMTCGQGYYPEYVVNVTKPEHVSAAVKFARDNNVRLNVKNTGHDFIGRNTARGSLSVWIGKWRGIEWNDEFTTSCSKQKYTAVTVTGGVQWKEVYAGAYAYNKAFVGGGSATVGVLGGYLQGGGHSPMGPTFGMGADNVLEYTVVRLSDGAIVKANSCTNSALFWALRGGGGGTFGIVISATIKTYPGVGNVVVGRLELNTTDTNGDLTPWTNAMAYFNSQLGNVSDNNITGYYFTLNTYRLHFDFWLSNGTAEALDSSVGEMVDKLKSMANAEGSNFVANYFRTVYPWTLFAGSYTTDKELNVGFGQPTAGHRDTVIGSRLIPRSAMEKDPAAYMDALMYALKGSTALLGHLVGGGKVAENRGLDTALNPAWRDALSHMVIYHEVSDLSGDAARKQARVDMTAKVARLKKLTPGSGAYMNECDVNEPDKANTFYGKNYPALYVLKQVYDPWSLMWCSNCVGYTDWEEVDGRLCRA